MEFKGTKGKWSKGIDLNGLGRTLIAPQKGLTYICDVYEIEGDKYKEEHLYNAALIRKAPEMLEMLMYAVNEHKSGEQLSKGWFDDAEKLIKSATEIK